MNDLDVQSEYVDLSPRQRAMKKTLKRAGRLVGFDIRRYDPEPRHALSTLLKLYRVETIFDVGANVGNSGQYFRNIGFKGRIVSFEPVRHLYRSLEEKARQDPLWSCENVALGAEEGEVEINVSSGEGSASSFLDQAETQTANNPGRETWPEKVQVKTLDSVIDRYYPEGERLFLKLDVEGFERNVLEGGRQSLDRVIGMKIELAVVENFKGEKLIHQMLPLLYTLGFRLHGMAPGFSNGTTQEIYQVDGFLFRPDKL